MFSAFSIVIEHRKLQKKSYKNIKFAQIKPGITSENLIYNKRNIFSVMDKIHYLRSI